MLCDEKHALALIYPSRARTRGCVYSFFFILPSSLFSRLTSSPPPSSPLPTLQSRRYSSYGGGRYFKNAVVNVVHKIGLEHYVLRTAMEEEFGVCLYD
jgi:hypothetical protein